MATYATSSAPAVIDSLILCFEDVLAGTNFQVFDGIPVDLPGQFITIGGTAAYVSQSDQEFKYIGNSAMQEMYDLDGQISAWVGGETQANPTSGPNKAASNAQKAARDAVYNALNLIGNALLNDKQLLNYGAPLSSAGWVGISKLDSMQSAYNDTDSAKGRRVDLTFTIQVFNYLGAIG